MTEGTESVDLPAELLARVDARLPHTEFATREAYLTAVLEEVLATVDADPTGPAVDEAQVKARLRSLGYLDS